MTILMETEKRHSLSLPSTQDVLAALRPGQRYSQPMPPGSGDACLIADLARQHKAPILVLCADPLTAQRLAEEILLFGPALRVRQLPDWETLPYDSFSPHQDLISERLRTLHALTMHEVDVLTVPVTTALYRLAPPSFLAAYTFSFRQGDELDEAQLRAQLMLANYTHMTQVSAPGEFSIRGGLIDLFPMGSLLPYRLDLFDNEIESIRSFDIDTQRSLYPVKEIQLLPGREFPMDEEARTQFRARFREFFEGDPSRALPYKDVGNGIAFAGIEYYLPLFFEETATLMDYVRWSAVNPAKAWGLYGTKGVIAPGAHADIAFVDMERTGTLSQNRLQSISKISPWNGRAVKGYPLHTLLRGRFVMREGKLASDAAGWGRSVKGVQKMPAAKPRNTEHYSSAILETPAGVPATAAPAGEVDWSAA